MKNCAMLSLGYTGHFCCAISLGMWGQCDLRGCTGSWFHSGTAGKILRHLPKLWYLVLILAPSQAASRCCHLRGCAEKWALRSHMLWNYSLCLFFVFGDCEAPREHAASSHTETSSAVPLSHQSFHIVSFRIYLWGNSPSHLTLLLITQKRVISRTLLLSGGI